MSAPAGFSPSGSGKAVTVIAAIFVSGIALGSFALSFAALGELASMSGIPESIAWVWPLIVDGSIVTAMLVIFAWRGERRRETAWPWTTLVFFALVSVVGNGVHTVAVLDGTIGISVPFAVFVGAIPPVSLLLSSEMLVRIMAGPRRRRVAATAAVAVPTTPEPEPDPVDVPEFMPVREPVAVPREVAPPAPTPAAVPVMALAEQAADTTGSEPVEPLTIPADEDMQRPTGAALSDTFAADAANESAVADTNETPDDTALPTVITDVPGPAIEAPRALGWHPHVIQGGGIPTTLAEQVAFVAERARTGGEVSAPALAALLDVSERTAARRLAAARTTYPEAFGAEPVTARIAAREGAER